MKRKILVIGIGAGNPDHLTIQAIKALNRADVLFIPDKGEDKASLGDARRDICARYIEKSSYRLVDFDVPPRVKSETAYRESIKTWRDSVEAVYERLVTDELSEAECGAFLVWGDPAIYDGTIRILEAIARRGNILLEYEVIPGISSVQALAASHRVPLNAIGGSFTVTTGRKLAQGSHQGEESLFVMLDGDGAYHNADPDLTIHWAAYAGTEDEVRVSGRLGDVAEEIDRLRNEARSRHGWIMDSYLLTRSNKSGQ